jgi:hypothetical protein
LEWLAAISPEHERRLRNLAKTPRGDEPRREQLEWLAAISPEYARQLRDLQSGEAIAAGARERSQRIIERLELERTAEAEWDDSKHPRAGGPPNAGWFVSTGSATALRTRPANASPRLDALAKPPRRQDQLAQAQQPAQPPAQGGQQANQRQSRVRPKAGTPAVEAKGVINSKFVNDWVSSKLTTQEQKDFAALQKQAMENPKTVIGTIRPSIPLPEASLYLSVGVEKNTLVVTARQGSRLPRTFGSLQTILSGSDPSDHDSAQVAVQWNPGTPGSTSATNANSDKATLGTRRAAAAWTPVIQAQDKWYGKSFTSFDIPAGATDVKLVVVYTDLASTTQSDPVGIAASWTGTRKPDGTWSFDPNLADIARIQDLDSTTQQARDVLGRMGFELQYRFFGLADSGYDIKRKSTP